MIELIQRNAFLVRLNTMPTHKLLIIYARQSTKEQVINNKKSTQQQTDDLLLLGIKYGWSQDDTVIFIENYVTRDGKLTDRIRNASGRLRIDQRPGLQIVTQLIEEGKVGAVLVWDVSRLFRDEDMIQPAIFAKLCKMQHVLVLTNEVVFDFNHPSRDVEKRFRDEAQAAAYLGKQIKKMNKARDRVALRGDMLDTACQPGSCSMMN